MAAEVPVSATLGGLAIAAEAKKQIKIIGLESDLLRVPADLTATRSTISAETAAAWFCG